MADQNEPETAGTEGSLREQGTYSRAIGAPRKLYVAFTGAHWPAREYYQSRQEALEAVQGSREFEIIEIDGALVATESEDGKG
jgi:hypothetical protein